MDRKKRLRQQRRPPAQRMAAPPRDSGWDLVATKAPGWEQVYANFRVGPFSIDPPRTVQLTRLDGRGDPTGKPIITSARNVTIDGKPFFEMTMKGTK